MKKEIGGKTYVQVPEKRENSCEGCVADKDKALCSTLHETWLRCDGKIWEEEKVSKKKTALELVDGRDPLLRNH